MGARDQDARRPTREMPPWHVDRTIGIQKFKDDPSLTDEEIATIAAWVDAGAPRGNPADMPPLRAVRRRAAAGRSASPISIVKFPRIKVPAAGPDLFGDLFTDIPI